MRKIVNRHVDISILHWRILTDAPQGLLSPRGHLECSRQQLSDLVSRGQQWRQWVQNKDTSARRGKVDPALLCPMDYCGRRWLSQPREPSPQLYIPLSF